MFLIYSRNKLTNTDLSDGSSTLGFPIRVMRNAILESGDKSLIKEVALKTGFDYNDFEKAKELGVDEVRIKSAQLYDFKHGNPLMPENEAYSRYKRSRTGEFVMKNRGGDHCWRMWSGSVVTWDGKVVPCCFDKDASYAMGELTKETFGQIWNNLKYKQFRNAILTKRQGIDICQNCTEGTKVWL